MVVSRYHIHFGGSSDYLGEQEENIMNKKKMFVVFIVTVIGIWLASVAINYYTYYMGPDIFEVQEFDASRVPNISAEKSNAFNNPSILTNLTEEEFVLLSSYPENGTNITLDDLKEYPSLEKSINGVDCIKSGSYTSLCKAASMEDFNNIRNFIESKRNLTVRTCYKFEKYENCYTFSFARP